MATFDDIRLEIERALAKVQEAEGENKRLLLRRLHRLINQADEAIATHYKLNPLADNLAIRRRLITLRSLVKIAMDAPELKNGDLK
jgi:hypothetical protein